MEYEDPNTPLHPKRSQKVLGLLLKKFTERASQGKKVSKSPVPLTKRNLEEFANPDYSDIHDAFLGIRPQRKVSIHEWLQLLP
jgi:hypothetical protein